MKLKLKIWLTFLIVLTSNNLLAMNRLNFASSPSYSLSNTSNFNPQQSFIEEPFLEVKSKKTNTATEMCVSDRNQRSLDILISDNQLVVGINEKYKSAKAQELIGLNNYKRNEYTNTYCPSSGLDIMHFDYEEMEQCYAIRAKCGINMFADNPVDADPFEMASTSCSAFDFGDLKDEISSAASTITLNELNYSFYGNSEIDICDEPGVDPSKDAPVWKNSKNPCIDEYGKVTNTPACLDLKLECDTNIFRRFHSYMGPRFCDEIKKANENTIISDNSKFKEEYGTITCNDNKLLGKNLSCNMVEGSVLFDSSNENEGIFNILSGLTRAGSGFDQVKTMNPDMCKKCWRAAYNTYEDSSKGKNFQEDIDALLKSINLSNKGQVKNNEYSIQVKFKMNLLASVLAQYDLSDDELQGVKCLSNDEVNKIYFENKCLSASHLDDLSVITKEELRKSINEYKEKRKNFNNSSRENKLSESIGEQEKSFMSYFGYLFDPKLLKQNSRAQDFRDNVIENCSGYLSSDFDIKNTFDFDDFYNFFVFHENEIDTLNASEMKKAKEEFQLAAHYAGLSNPNLFGMLNGYDVICNLVARNNDPSTAIPVNELVKVLNENSKKTNERKGDVIFKFANGFCPRVEDILETKECQPSEINENDIAKIKSPHQKIILKEMICKGDVKYVSSREQIQARERESQLSSLLSNPTDIKVLNTFVQSNMTDDKERRISRITGNQLYDGIIGGTSSSEIVGQDLNPLATISSDSISENINFDDFSKQVNNLKSTFSNNVSSMLGNNTNESSSLTNFTDSDIQQTIQSEPAAQNLMDSIASNIENSADKEINAIENPGQAIMDYLKDKETASSEALENSQLRAQLDELKKLVAEKKVTEARKIKENDKIELDAAKARIRNLEGMISQLRNPAAANANFGNTVSDGFSQSGEASGNYGVDISRGRLGSSGAGNSAFGGGRGPASAQSPLINKIPKSVGEDLKRFANSGIEMKGESLVLRVDESSYPLEVEEVIMNNGIISGIKVQNSFKGSVEVLSMSELNSNSKKAVEEYIEKMASSILAVEEDKLAEVKAKADASAARYIDFLCASNPERSECKQ